MECRGNGLLSLMGLVSPAIVLTAILAAIGCSGSERVNVTATRPASHPVTSSTTASSSSDASRFTAKADSICKRLDAELTAPKRLVMGEIARSARRNAALERKGTVELSKLPPPALLARDWRQILMLREKLADGLVRLVRYAQANDIRAIRTLTTAKLRIHQELSRLATHDGFRYCSQVIA